MALTIDDAKPRMQATVDKLLEDLKKLRTGRASASMLDNVQVEVYGQRTPLSHAATITAVDAQMIQVSPFDPNNLDAISTAIRDDQALGLNPADDGKVIRLPIPPMTTERRQEVVKQLKERVEEANVSLRNARHDVINTAKQQWKDKDIGEDDLRHITKEVDELVDGFKHTIDEMAKSKETEIMTV